MTLSNLRTTHRRRWAFGVLSLATALASIAGLGYQRYLSGGGYAPVAWQITGPPELSLQAALEADLAANPSLHGASLYILAPDIGLDHGFAAGAADADGDLPMTPDHALRIASVTKSYVAATAVRLQEQGLLSLQTPLADALAPETNAHLLADGYDTDAIRLADLLNHRSGIADYAQLSAYTRQIVFADLLGQQRVWTRAAQLQFALDHTDPLWEPDGGFSYSDTGYILLGEAIERATGRPLPEAVRDALQFEQLGLSATWWEDLEATPPGMPRPHQFMGRVDITGVDASIDLFGGGGLVATTRDMGHAIRAIVVGEMFENTGSVELMRDRVDGSYANGLVRYAFPTGHVCWGHSGFWGLVAFHCPAEDVTIAMSYSQANVTGLRARAEAILAALNTYAGGLE